MTTQTLSDGSVLEYGSDGTLLKETSPDGSVYTGFDSQGRAHHMRIPASASGPATTADIAYHGDHTIYTYADKSVITYDADSHILSEKLADGSHYTQFDADGQAHHVDIPAANGNPATSASISYADGNAVYHYQDGSTVTYNGGGDILDEKLADGSDYSKFDANNQAHHVDIPAQNGNPATSAEIAYQDGNTVYTYQDQTVVTYDSKGGILDEKTADGSDYTRFDSSGKAHHVETPAQNGNPATSADISYQNGDSVYTYADHTVVTYDGKGKISDEKTADGSDYTNFDQDNRPHHVETPATATSGPTSADIAYDNAYTYYTYADKTKLQYQTSDNTLVKETMPNGSVYTGFDVNNKPHHVDVPPYDGRPATSADISYADGKVIYTYPDQTVLTYDEKSNTLLTQKSPEGLLYSDFQDDKPHHVEIPPLNGKDATWANISYDGDHTIYTYKDQSIITYAGDGKTILTEQMPDGYTYSNFTGDKPRHVDIPAQNGNPKTWADITYDGDHTTYTYQDKTVVTYAGDGKTILTEKTPDGYVYSNFTGNKAGHVDIPAQNGNPKTWADITYDGDHTTYTYENKTVVTYGPDGKTILTEKMPDGTVYSGFDSNNNPSHVDIPAQNGKPATSAEITYANGQATYTYPDGTKVTFDMATNNIVKQEMANGWTINYTGGKPSSGINSKTGQTVTITPDGQGGSIWTYSGGGPVVYEDKDGHPYLETSNGWTFNQFNSDGLPTDGFMILPDGTKETAHVDYDIDDAHDNKYIYTTFGKDGPTTTTVITNSDGVPLSQAGNDGVLYSYEVLMSQFLDAIHQVSAQRDTINSTIKQIHDKFSDIHQYYWTGPGSDHFYAYIDDFMNLSNNVAVVLSDSIQRMESTYNNYVDVEKAVFKTLTPVSVESTPKFDSNGNPV
jgi:hypothetical protein